jgi:hypothetical protein
MRTVSGAREAKSSARKVEADLAVKGTEKNGKTQESASGYP